MNKLVLPALVAALAVGAGGGYWFAVMQTPSDATLSDAVQLLSIYSPKLVTSQQQYLLALKNLESLKALRDSPYADILEGAKDMAASSRERLRLLDVPAHQICMLERERAVKKSLHIHSPFDGIVLCRPWRCSSSV